MNACRAYAAHPSTVRYGSAESALVVRRPLSLTASLPRFARVGDTFQAGVLITAPATGSSMDSSTPSAIDVDVSVESVQDEEGDIAQGNATANATAVTSGDVAPLVLTSSVSQQQQRLSLSPGAAPAEVRWAWRAQAVGRVRLVMRARSSGAAASGGEEDAISVVLSVEGEAHVCLSWCGFCVGGWLVCSSSGSMLHHACCMVSAASCLLHHTHTC